MVAIPARVATVTAGGVARSSDFNNTSALGNLSIYDRPIGKAHQTTSTAIANVTLVPTVLDATDIDSDGMRTGAGSATDRFVVRTAGWYQVAGGVSFAPNATGNRYVSVFVNGTPANVNAAYLAANANNPTIVNLTGLLRLAVNDYVQLSAYQASGGSLNTDVSANQQSTLSLIFVLAG
jgi:hypothetical protein